jgi:cytochrome c-type biogenesis protein CcmH
MFTKCLELKFRLKAKVVSRRLKAPISVVFRQLELSARSLDRGGSRSGWGLLEFSLFLLLLSIGTLAVSSALGQEFNANASPFESKLKQLTTSVYCYCGCTRETIQHCVCGTAEQVENQFRDSLKAGLTVEKIRNDYLTTYGTQYSALMPAKGFNIVAYVMPVVIFAALGATIFLILLYVMKSKRSSPTTQPVKTDENRTVTEDRYKQIEAEIERYKQER